VQLVLATMAERPAEKGSSEEEERPQLMARIWMDDGVTNSIAIGSPVGIQALTVKTQTLTKPPVGQSLLFDIESSKGCYRASWMRVAMKDGPGNIVVAQSTGEMYGELHELLWNLVLTTFGVLVAVIVMSGALIMLGIRPIRQTAQRLTGITAGNLGQLNLESSPVPAELEPFVVAVSGMLDRLETAIQQQKNFIADAAHELRTPIAVAKSTLQVAVASDHSPEEYRAALLDATEDLRRLEYLVDELLTLARLDESHGLTQAQELDLAQLLEDLAESFKPRISGAGGNLLCDRAPALVRGNAQQLQRLFSNLLDNALRHGPAGGEIRLKLRTMGDAVEVIVHDQGGNISPEDLPHLFDRFYRPDHSRSRTTGGVGLGLAIARTIAVRHGGDIIIESTPVAGTSFVVRLPVSTQSSS